VVVSYVTRLAALVALVTALSAGFGSGAAAQGKRDEPHGATAGPHSAQQNAVRQAFSRLPLMFEANRGQTDRQVRFLARGSGYTLFLTTRGATVVTSGATPSHPAARAGSLPPFKPFRVPSGPRWAFQLTPVGMSSHVQIAGQQRLPGRVNYLVGSNPKQWHTTIPLYGAVLYRNLYSGIDLRFYGTSGRGLEYDWIIHPGADASKIAFAVKGASGVRLDGRGNLVMRAGKERILQGAPRLYQVIGGTRRAVRGHFMLQAEGRVGFHLGSYDRHVALVIDPAISYSTYLGGTGDDASNAIAVDSNGDAFVTGQAGSADFPEKNGYQPFRKQPGLSDAFVTELGPPGNTLIYSTYFGGTGEDQGNGIALDPAGEAYVTGVTTSLDLATKNAFQPNHHPSVTDEDAFVTKFNAKGSALLFSTYLGGGGDDEGYSVALDALGNAYVAGTTSSGDFPTTAGVVQPHPGGDHDAFVTKFAPAGVVAYSTYLGGSVDDEGYAIAVCSQLNSCGGDAGVGTAFVAGATSSTDFPTKNAAQTTNFGGVSDAFVTTLNAAGSSLVYSTYLGGSFFDAAFGITLNNLGFAYVTGGTTSDNYSITPNAFQPTYALGIGDAFVTVLSANGAGPLFSSYLGGSGMDEGTGIALLLGRVPVVTGVTGSADFPLVKPVQSVNAGFHDAFVSVIDPSCECLSFSTYLGGHTNDAANGLAVVGEGIYLTGQTASTDFPVRHPFQAVNHGGADGFVTLLGDSSRSIPNIPDCAGVAGSLTNSQPPGNVAYSLTAVAQNGGLSGGMRFVETVRTTAGGPGSPITVRMTKVVELDTDGGGGAEVIGTGNVYVGPVTSTSTPVATNATIYVEEIGANWKYPPYTVVNVGPATIRVVVDGSSSNPPFNFDSGLLSLPVGANLITYC
jgi:hypothetical protein